MTTATRRFDRTGWAMDQPNLTPPQKAALTVLADASSEAEGLCWLKYATIAHRTSYGTSTVRRAVYDLIELELLRKAPRYDAKGRQTSNYYQLGCYEAVGALVEGAQSEHPLGARSEQGEVPAASTSIVNQPEGAGLQNSRKTSSSSPETRRARSGRRTDDGPDQSTLDEINDQLTPGRRPTAAIQTRRVTRKQTAAPKEHAHNPHGRKAENLGCYWAVNLERIGSLESKEEQIVTWHFRRWLEMGLTAALAKKMVDAFFADPRLVKSNRRWQRFVRNVEMLRNRVSHGGAERVYEDNAEQRLPAWAREAMEKTA